MLWDACLAFPIPKHSVVNVLSKSVDSYISDGILQDYLNVLMPDADYLVAETKSLLGGSEVRYPLTRASVAILERKLEEGRALLSSATPGTEVEEIIRLVMLLRVSLSDPATTEDEARSAYVQWAKTTLPTIRNLVRELSQPIDNVLAFAQIKFVQLCTSVFDKDREQEMEFMGNSVKDKVRGNPNFDKSIRATEIRFEKVERLVPVQ